MEESSAEKTKRINIVWGIAVAAAIGFILNLLANLYYDLFIGHAITWDKVDQGQVVWIGLVLLGLIGFLQFFIDDYKNGVEINKSLIKRFTRYFFYQFKPGKVIRIITGIYLLLVLAVIAIFLYIGLAKSTGYLWATTIYLSVFLVQHIKTRKQREALQAQIHLPD